jgi:membrane associated rhomboid family serine protease
MFPAVPPVTRVLIVVNVAVYLLQQVASNVLIPWFALWPLNSAPLLGGAAGFQAWQVVTYSFLHGSLMHLFFNMFALYMFGGEIERTVGAKRYLQYYFAAVVTAALTQLVFAAASHAPPYPTVGASGGIFGLLLAFGRFFPRRIIVLLIPPIPMPAWLFVTLYGAIELYLGVTGSQAGVAHFAHLGGMLGGWLMLRYWEARRPRW